jgi:galactose-1-phosphate uridylyltransferase
MTQMLSHEALEEILQAGDVEKLSVRDLVALTREEIDDFLPDGVYRIDPRNGDRILYHSSRGRRPHDNVPESMAEIPERECIICDGDTTGVVDIAELSEGFTFINKNLFPILYPFEDEGLASGLHFLQWTSSHHDKDWHNMPLRDRVVVLERLAALERTLLAGADELPAIGADTDRLDLEEMPRAFVVIIKNYGRLVGGSLIHGHQQIAFGNVMPRHFRDNARFEKRHGEPFSEYMIRETPSELVIKDYGPAILLVPPFMRRPYDMMLLLKERSRRYVHQLSGEELEAVAEGWHDGIRAVREIMPRVGREIAYNVITNNGPGAGLYFEFLPYTQEIGGVEHLGLLVCQELPERAAARLREIIL